MKTTSLALLALLLAAAQTIRSQTIQPPAESRPGASAILPADRVTERRALLAKLSAAENAGDLARAAELNAELAAEAWSRALRVSKAWEQLRDPETGLVPRSLKDRYWNGRDVGSDCWPFLFLASADLEPARSRDWLPAIENERRLSGPLPQRIYLNPTRVEQTTINEQLFDGAEYIKDGLLFLTERLGDGPWQKRVEEIADALIERSVQPTKRGLIPGNGTEINGNLLVLMSRLYWLTKKPAYLEMAQRIGDVYLLDIMPAFGGLPPLFWDFASNAPPTAIRHSGHVKYRDHGNETIFGLAELYFLEKRLGLESAERHRIPLRDMLDKILVFGRRENGLWANSADIRTGGTFKGTADNWGYLLNALQTYDLAEGTFRYTLEIRRTMLGAAKLKSYVWENSPMDGYADAIESMMYMLPWYDLPEARDWINDEIEILFSLQKPSGFAGQTYLDGNFVRTSLLYARYKTLGIQPDPWREDLRLGAARDTKTGKLVIHVSAAQPWKGVLRFDRPRHKEFWGMPENYPRLNAAHEWFTAPADAKFTVTQGSAPARETTGTELVAGLPVTLEDGASIKISVAPAAK